MPPVRRGYSTVNDRMLIASVHSAASIKALSPLLNSSSACGTAAAIAVGFAVVLWSWEPSYTHVDPNLSGAEAAEVARRTMNNS